MNASEEIRNLWTKVSGDEEDGMVTVQGFLEEQETMAKANPEEIVEAITNLKNESLKLGETPLGLKYYTEARLMQSTVMPLVNETVAAQIEDRMIDLERNAVTLAGVAMKKLVNKRNKQLQEIRAVNRTLDKVSGGIRGIRKLFKKINNEKAKLFDVVGTVSFSIGPKVDREILETVAEQWQKDISKFSGQNARDIQVKS